MIVSQHQQKVEAKWLLINFLKRILLSVGSILWLARYRNLIITKNYGRIQ